VSEGAASRRPRELGYRSRVLRTALGPALAAVSLTLAASACQDREGGGSRPATRAFPQEAVLGNEELSPGTLLRARGDAIGPVAVGAGGVAWARGPLEGEDEQPLVYARRAGSRRDVLVGHNINRNFGIVAMTRSVVYVGGPLGRDLLAVPYSGGRARRLTRHVVAPIAGRGALVAWAEQDASAQRVVVLDEATGRRRVVARLRACDRGRCYRIDAVTLARDGVVFARGAIGEHPSQIVRVRFGGGRLERHAVPGDPQPDLVDASDGALFYVLLRGWYRWDFGDAEPRRVDVVGPTGARLLGYEDGRYFVERESGCDDVVEARHARGTSEPIVPLDELHALAPPGRRCVVLGGIAWTARSILTGWAVAVREAEEEHEDAGLRGALIVTPLPR
jgi:hypothetical protein